MGDAHCIDPAIVVYAAKGRKKRFAHDKGQRATVCPSWGGFLVAGGSDRGLASILSLWNEGWARDWQGIRAGWALILKRWDDVF